MKAEANALVLLKKNQFFSIATFFRKIFFLHRKENLIKEVKEEKIINNQSEIEENEDIISNLSMEQIKILEKTYQREIEELERQIKLIEARNKMCEFQLQMYEKEKIQSE